jgi:hypothetical protein
MKDIITSQAKTACTILHISTYLTISSTLFFLAQKTVVRRRRLHSCIFVRKIFFATHLQLPESFFLTVGARPTIDFMHLHTKIDRAEARKLKAAADPLLENPLILGTDCLRPRRNHKHSGSKLLG